MKRQLLAGHFGPDDRTSIPTAADEQLTRLEPGVLKAMTVLRVGISSSMNIQVSSLVDLT